MSLCLAVLRGELAYLLKMAAEVEGRVSRPRPWWPLLSFPPSSPRDASFPPCHFPISNGGRTPLRPPSVLTPHSLSPPPLPLGAPRPRPPPGPPSRLMRGNKWRAATWAGGGAAGGAAAGRGSIYFLSRSRSGVGGSFSPAAGREGLGGLGVRRSMSSGCLHCTVLSHRRHTQVHARVRTRSA